MCSLLPSYFIKNDSLKYDFSLCLPKFLVPVHSIKQSYCKYEASLKEFIS